MADSDKQMANGFSDVINSIDKASSEELAALARIERKVTGTVSSSPGSKSTASAIPRSVLLAQERQKRLENDRKKTINEQSGGGGNNRKKPSNNRQITAKLKVGHLPSESQANDGNLTVNIVLPPDQAGKSSFPRDKTDKKRANDSNLPASEQAREEALRKLRSAKRQPGQNSSDGSGRAREGNGRFTSRDKVQQDKHDKERKAGSNDDIAERQKSDALLTRIGKMLSANGDPLDADTTNTAGTAAGGSFWKAGHEVYTLGKNTVVGGASGVQKMRDVMGGEKDEDGKKNNGLIRRMFTRGKSGGNATKRNSASVIAATAQKEQVKATENQTDAIKEGNEQIVEKLDDLLKEKSGKKSSGLWGLLGAAAMGKMGKKLLAGVLAGLGAKGLADRLRGGDGGRKRKRKKGSSLLGGDCGCDADLPGSGPDRKKKKPSRRERKKSIRNAGKKSLLSRIGKKGLIAGGTLAAGAAAADAVADAVKDAPKPAKAVEKAADKTAAKVAAKEAGTAAAVAGTGAAAAATKVASTKAGENAAIKAVDSTGSKVAAKGAAEVAEKTGAKLATKTALGATLRAVPVVGQVIGAGIDGVMGWRDKEGQQSAFDLKEGQEATKRQKAEYTAANVLDMGGLVSGGAGLLAKGANALGFNNVANKLTFSTEDIAKGIDSKVTSAKGAVKNATDFLGITKPDKAKDAKAADDRTQSLVTAIQDGAKNTVAAITALVGTGATMVAGAAENVSGATQRVIAGFTQPTTDDLSPDLNIGGANAKNRNFRNNNFGNLNYVGQDGARLENANANGERRFARFDTPEEGMRALGNQLMSYSNGTSRAANYQKLNTVDQIISKYAPETENNTKAYKASLAQQLGVGVNDQINMKDPQVMTKMIRAISTIEGGNPQVSDKFISNALGQYQQSDSGKGKWVGQFNDSTLAIVNKQRATQGQDLLTKDAQLSGIATAKGKSVDAVKAADVTPVSPVLAGTNTTQNGVQFRAAQLPLGIGQNTAIGQKLANAEGLRHQVGKAPNAISAAPAQDIEQQVKDIQTASQLKQASQPASLQQNVQAIADAEKAGGSLPAEAISRPLGPTAGVQYRAARLPLGIGQNTAVGQKIANAEGLRHQVSPGSAQVAATARPTMAIPSKLPSVTDMAASNIQPTVHVSNAQTFPKEVKATFEKIAKSLERIEGHTKDTADKSGDQSPKANTPQPAPRSSTPLSINDPLMASVAND